MNQTFDARRWWLLVGKHWSENRKKYALSLVAIAGLLLILFLTMFNERRSVTNEIQVTTYYSGLFIVGCLYASMLFADLASKTRGLNYLLVPASQLEKLLCALFYGVIVFFVCYTALFYLVDFIAVKVSNTFAYSRWVEHHSAQDVFEGSKVYNVFVTPNRDADELGFVFYLLLFFFVLQAAFIYGSIFFAKFNFIKSIIALLVIGLFISFVIAKLIAPILPPGSYRHGITSYEVYTVKSTPSGDGVMIYSDAVNDKLVSIPEWIGDVLLFLLKYALAPLFWLAAYYRLKEKEI